MYVYMHEGIQSYGGVLLGAVSRGIELRRSVDPQHSGTNHQDRFDCEARGALEWGGLPGLQHLHLVDELGQV